MILVLSPWERQILGHGYGGCPRWGALVTWLLSLTLGPRVSELELPLVTGVKGTPLHGEAGSQDGVLCGQSFLIELLHVALLLF